MTIRVSASPRRSARNSLRGETSRRVIATLISTGMVLQPIAASATPTNGTVVGGNATINTAGNTTTIEQIDARVVIDWESFDIDANETVQFNQPGSNAVALNRVLGELPTDVRGQLLANGHVWIVNRNGVTFHAGSVVNVGSLLATTADISNADFLAGQNNFTIPGEEGATVTNNGSITFGNAGLAGLVAPGASNNGQIVGQLGSVIVAGERTFAIDFAGDGMFAFEPRGVADFRGRATNTGSISNSGGYILIAARTASGMVDEAISLGGIVEATTAEMRNGRIVLSAGDGLVNIAGTVDASGGAGETGGSVQVSGGRVNVGQAAHVDVSGGVGGGTAEIGGGYQGASLGVGLRNAQDTIVQPGATIAADAGQSGDGGTVVVWADGRTGYAGSISATGGVQSGNGGKVEVSGLQDLIFVGDVDTNAPTGERGTLLLDPINIEIVAGAPANDDGLIADDIASFLEMGTGEGNVPPTAAKISAQAIDAQDAHVTLQATNDISVDTAVSLDHSITLDAGNNITLDNSITTTVPAADIMLNAGNNINLNADVNAGGAAVLNASASVNGGMPNPSGTINFGGGGSVTGGTNVTLSAGDALILGNVTATGGDIVLNATGAVMQLVGTSITTGAPAGTVSVSTEGMIALSEGTNSFTTIALNTDTVGDGGGMASVTVGGALKLGATTASNLTVAAGGAVTQTDGHKRHLSNRIIRRMWRDEKARNQTIPAAA